MSQSTKEKSKEDIHVVIVGAGIAGLSAADHLINRFGFKNVTILEAQDRIGGRVHPIPFGDGYLQMGAEWIHGSQNPIYGLAKEVGVLPTREESQKLDSLTSYFLNINGCELSEELLETFYGFFSEAEENLEEIAQTGILSNSPKSVGEIFEDSFENFLSDQRFAESDEIQMRAIFEFARKTVEIEHAASDWRKISLRTWSEYVELPREEELTINKFGYKAILDSLESRIQNCQLRLNSRVTNIDWSQLAIRILLANQEEVVADHVIVTCALGHLQHYGLQLFSPELPRKKWTAIQNMGFDSVDKVFLVYDEPFWQEDAEQFNLIRASGDCADVPIENQTELSSMFSFFDVHPWHSGILLAFIGGDDAAKFESATDQEISHAATVALKKFNRHSTVIPYPIRIFRSFWHSDSLFHGSYSWYSVSADKSNSSFKDIAEPLFISHGSKTIPVVLFAGEATHPSMFQTTHGAMITGWREARRLNKLYSHSPHWVWRAGLTSSHQIPTQKQLSSVSASGKFSWNLLTYSLGIVAALFRTFKQHILRSFS